MTKDDGFSHSLKKATESSGDVMSGGVAFGSTSAVSWGEAFRALVA